MKATKIEGATHLLKGNGDNVGDLHVYSNGRVCISKWQLTEDEIRDLIQNNGVLYLTVFHPPNQFPPVGLSIDNPVPAFIRPI